MPESTPQNPPPPPPVRSLKKVKHVVAIASAKGGVGKSTVAVNLALSLVAQGHQVGLLDADIYGPSVPTLMGLQNTPPLVDQQKKKIIPLEKHGLKTISIGYLMKAEEAAVWRGPMVGRMLQQFLFDVDWGELDYLVMDLPPGTGDAQLSLAQMLPISGAVIVSTPQEVALADVVRGVAMFEKVRVPLAGLVENMSYFSCPKCEEKTEIFSHGGGRKKAEELKIPFLGELPLDLSTRIGSDEGKAIVIKEPAHEQSKRFLDIAKKLTEVLAEKEKARKGLSL